MMVGKYSRGRRVGTITETPAAVQGATPRVSGEATGGNAERAGAIASSHEAIVCVVAALSTVAALTNLWAAPRQYVELWGYDAFLWWGYAAIYLLLYLAQGLYGVALLRWPTQQMFRVGLAGALGAILLYVTTRTVGIPFGPAAGRLKEAELLDILGIAAEVGVIISLLAALEKRHREKAITVLLVLVAAAWTLKLLGVLS